jgi:16S rRNA (uracil1498-N3)-methyltransferase
LVYRLVIDPTQENEGQFELNLEQQHYLKRVLRLKEGDRFVAMNGKGNTWLAQLNNTSAKILEPLSESSELPIAVTLMVALPKGNGFDEIVRCCTELGVTAFIPVIGDRTLLNPSVNKIERWRKIATEAAEQSERQIVPTILEPINFIKALTQINNLASDRYICVTRTEAKSLLIYLKNQPPKNIIIAIGPEGGWTEAEIEKAISVNFVPVSLGRRILRTITAPIVAVSVVTAIIEEENEI